MLMNESQAGLPVGTAKVTRIICTFMHGGLECR